MPNQTPEPVKDVLDELRNLVTAVNQGTLALTRVGQGTNEPNLLQASVALDFRAIRQLLGRQDGEESLFISVTRTGSTLDLFDVPDTATDVAVFTGPGLPAEIRPLGGSVTARGSKAAHHTVTLTAVPPTKVITRTEVRRADGVPIRLGPRLEAS
jgi:hypothetical protein